MTLPSPRDAELAAPSARFAASYIEALEEGFRRGIQTPLTPARIIEIKADFQLYLEDLQDQTGSLYVPGIGEVPKVPFTIHWLVLDQTFIAELSFRHELNEWLLLSGGHIGYGVRPSWQRHGFGRRLLELGLEEARRVGLDRVLITAHACNIGSRRVIEANGGVLENVVDDILGGGPLCRYWITL
jgi:predicted acetyltransferase